MKKIIAAIITTTALFVGFNAHAQIDDANLATVMAALKNIDTHSAECNVEVHGDRTFRILSTGFNAASNHYFDLDFIHLGLEFKAERDGFTLSNDIDLGEQAINPMFPKFLYGRQITKIQYKESERDGTLSVYFNPSTLAWGAEIKFVCHSFSMNTWVKTKYCPSCLSNQ